MEMVLRDISDTKQIASKLTVIECKTPLIRLITCYNICCWSDTVSAAPTTTSRFSKPWIRCRAISWPKVIIRRIHRNIWKITEVIRCHMCRVDGCKLVESWERRSIKLPRRWLYGKDICT